MSSCPCQGLQVTLILIKRMQMLFTTNKDKGRAGLAIGVAYFASNGYTVNLPLNDTQ